MAILVQHQYKIDLNTGDFLHSSTSDSIYATLIGTDWTSERTNLANSVLDFMTGKVRTYTVTTPSTLGRLLLVKLEKEQYLFLPENKWFCSKVVVTTPEHDVIYFPCYKWVSRGEVVELRGGKASKVFEDELPLLVHHRKKELERHKKLFQWSEFAEGLPHINSAKELSALPAEVLFSFSKEVETIYTRESGMFELKLKGLADSTKQWEDFDKMKKVFWFRKTPISEYVSEHWKEDDFFGSQFLNGTNPNVIQRCTTLPPNFPVTDEMVQPSLEDGSSLETEMKKGNIFICDYKRLEGVPTRVVNGEPLPLTAALCLFYNNPEDNLTPIAIQLEQQPSQQNPIFLPSDSEHDWLLAKMFVRNADFIEHQNSYHLLGTHLLAEAFAMATLRSLPIMHPLHKLLISHFRYTFPVNTISREILFGPEEGLTKDTTLGLEGLKELLKRAHSEITYSSLCLPENIVARGLESIPKFYYREDGLKLWNVINSFVQGMVEHFYSSDSEVSRDSELQDWINEIFIHGFLGNGKSGIPQRFDTVKEVIKFITMVIFTVSAQHSAVSMGQFDYCSWVPNSPIFLCKAPPTTKGCSSMSTIFETLPDVGSTVRGMASIWLLSKKYSDFIPLGSYPNQYFDETDGYFDVTKQMMKHFQAELSYLSESITERNSTFTPPYNYLNPAEMENSVSM
ncbi:hydroperoxide isomerase ALOXE3-like [Salvelinus fontinalis]|uniref:hydroperoxide isomerase ALOXE3-like n=1 Tax=Salvelinus fontinalis TaxID=8038 RepID=UPI002485B494|nr:hydroperoxide isomerase ALOXE3-like [Salvelinus fontinalis]